jgi:hypothetical protein
MASWFLISPVPRNYAAARFGSHRAMMKMARHYYSQPNGYYRGNYWLLKSAMAGNLEAAEWIGNGIDPRITNCFWVDRPQPAPEFRQMKINLDTFVYEESKKGHQVTFEGP